jgi:leucyl aminopeptidase
MVNPQRCMEGKPQMPDQVPINPNKALPVFFCASKPDANVVGERAARFAAAAKFDPAKPQLLLVAGADGAIECALFGAGGQFSPMDAGRLSRLLPAGDWRLAGDVTDPQLASLSFILGSYSFDRYRKPREGKPQLALGREVDANAVMRTAAAVFLARDLINMPTNDLGPAELEAAIRTAAKPFRAKVSSVVGDDLLKQNFPMVHAVGRASAGAPRIVELRWGRQDHPKVTLVGKGVCFDSGGLNIKPGDSMALMKKDMGGAASTLALARMIMAAKLPVCLRLIIPAVENAISGNAFRPGDVLKSRKGLSVEIGNTDAEGRLILGDALAWGDEESPELMIDMATLTGAARVALGPDLPAMYTANDQLAADIAAAGAMVHDPVWRMPLWTGYRKDLSSDVADISHISKGAFAGSITAALFLERFVEKAKAWVHFDAYCWIGSEKPWAPVGGEAQAVRAIFAALQQRYP